MAYKSNNNLHNKEFISKNSKIATTASKFKPVLVKDLYQSFEEPKQVTKDLIQSNKNISKTDGVYQKIRKSTNTSEGSSEMFTSNKRLKISSNVDQSNFNNTKSVYSEMQNLNVNAVPCNCKKVQCSNNATSKPDFDLTNMVGVIQNIVVQLKLFLEQFLQAHEDQTSTLKQILNNIDSTINLSHSNNLSAHDKASNVSEVAVQTENSQTSLKTVVSNLSSSTGDCTQSDDKNSHEKKANSQEKVERRFPLIKLINNGESNQEVKRLSVDHLDLLSKSVRGIEADDSSVINPGTPMSVKTPRRRTIAAESKLQDRRRSLSTPSELNVDATQGSFTMLEKQLNIVHKKLTQTNSMLVAPMQVSPSTPTFAMQWDRKVKRPLKEYMALKEKSDFLLTPDISWLKEF